MTSQTHPDPEEPADKLLELQERLKELTQSSEKHIKLQTQLNSQMDKDPGARDFFYAWHNAVHNFISHARIVYSTPLAEHDSSATVAENNLLEARNAAIEERQASSSDLTAVYAAIYLLARKAAKDRFGHGTALGYYMSEIDNGIDTICPNLLNFGKVQIAEMAQSFSQPPRAK